MIFDWNTTTTNLLLANVKSVVSDATPIIIVLLGIFVAFWLLESLINIIRYKTDLTQEKIDAIEKNIMDEADGKI